MSDYDKFMEKVEIDEETGCWNWNGAIEYHGYGVMAIGGKQKKANEFAYEYFIGEIPDNHAICNTCKPNGDNPRCVNPEHMYLATKEDKIKSLEETKKPLSKAKIKMITDLYEGVMYYNIAQIARKAGVTPGDVKKITKKLKQGGYE